MNKIIDRLQRAAKAVVTLVAPIVSVALTEAVAELSTSQDTLVAAVATAILVYLTPNKATTA